MNELSPAGASSELGLLPQWNLGDLYQSTSAPALEADLTRAAEESKAFRQAWEGKLATASGEALGQAIAAYDKLQDLMGRIGSYAQLVYAGNMTDPAIAQFY
ncbi:MAG TPA: oligoendopeptidase F, partial [Dongiaceae bacterium]|nr:oligoendopeptidase F [Dongiaceae bacterium]